MKYLILMALLTIKLRKELEILGIKIDNNLNFNKHIKWICRKAGKTIINTLFEFQNNEYKIRNFRVLSTDFRKTANYGIETVNQILDLLTRNMA